MKNYISQILIVWFLMSCDSKSSVNLDTFDCNCLRVPQNKEESFFPLKAFDDSTTFEGHTEYLSNWFSKHLFSMNEPIIFECTENAECYRFTWLRTFHEPIAIRITRSGDKIILNWKKTNGSGGYDAGDLIESGSRELSEKEFDIFKNKLEKCNFFNLSTVDNLLGNDGAQWILEGMNREHSYHIVDRWAASESSFGKACLYLLELSNLKVQKELIY